MESRIKDLNKRKSKHLSYSNDNVLSGVGLIVILIGVVFFLMLALQTPGVVRGHDGMSGDGVTPTLITGANNDGKDCEDLPSNNTEFRIDGADLANGSFDDGTLFITITNLQLNVSDKIAFDWSSNVLVTDVVVKDGVDGANHYFYNPGDNGDTNLTTPHTQAGGADHKNISHINFCYDPSQVNPTLVITKVCVGGTGESFGYEVAPDGSIPTVDCGSSSAPIILVAGTPYVVTENTPLPDGWTLTSDPVTCTGIDETPETDGVSFTPTFDDEIECTFTNTFEVDSGSIEICKNADGLVAGDEFDFNIDGPGIDQNFDLEDGNCQLFNDLDLGEYVVIELDDDDLVDIDCEIIDNGPGGDDSNIDIDEGDAMVTIDLASDEHIGCLFTNDEEVPLASTPVETPTSTPVPPVDDVAGVVTTPDLVDQVSSLPSTGSGGGTESPVVDWLMGIGLVVIGAMLLLSGRLLATRDR